MEEQKDKKDDDGEFDSACFPMPKTEENVNQSDTDAYDTSANKGKLLLDATCAPADIAYPTDLDLLNEAREKLEHIIDVLHEPLKGDKQKPRTYAKEREKIIWLSQSKEMSVTKSCVKR